MASIWSCRDVTRPFATRFHAGGHFSGSPGQGTVSVEVTPGGPISGDPNRELPHAGVADGVCRRQRLSPGGGQHASHAAETGAGPGVGVRTTRARRA